MIIDAHTHLGIVPGRYDMPLANQLKAMELYHIDYALISDISTGECFGLAPEGVDWQYTVNRDAIAQIRPYADKLGLLLWCCPGAAGFNDAFEQLYLENRDIIKGLKVHPDISGVAFDDDRMIPYLEMAQKYDLPVLTHTADNPHSKISCVCNMAEKFPDVKIILGHLCLGSLKDESFDAMEKYPNLYGDTAWVTMNFTADGCNRGLEDKILFGTDGPIGNIHTCGNEKFYGPYHRGEVLSKEAWEKVMFRNAIRIFKLDL